MRQPYLLAILAVGVMLAAGTYAAIAGGGLSGAAASIGTGVQPADLHAGDQMRYERSWTDEDEDGQRVERRIDAIATVEGAGDATDRHGRRVAVESVRVDLAEDDAAVVSERCAAVAGGTQTVRRDVLAGDVGMLWTYAQHNVLDAMTSSESSARYDARTIFYGDCLARSPLGGVDLRVGDTLALAEATAGTGARFDGVADTSTRAASLGLHGRDALTLRFPALDPDAPAGAGFTVTYADGLPGVVEAVWSGVGTVRFEHGWADSDLAPVKLSLVGYAPREAGARVPVALSPPEAPVPVEDLAPFDPLALDDSAFAFRYAYREAFDALVADPSVCLGDFLAQNPDASLVSARYDASERDPFLFDAPTDGGWEVRYQAGLDTCGALSVRLQTPIPGMGAVRNYPEEMPVLREGGAAHDEIAAPALFVSPDATVQLLAAEGVDADDVTWLRYGVDLDGQVRLDVGTMPFFGPDEEGRAQGVLVYFDPAEAALRVVADGEGERVEELTLSPFGAPWGFPQPERSAMAILGGPFAGQGLAAAGALAAIVIAATAVVKWMVAPLYTRLTRDALLENPTRSRLYEQVRRDPGIHQAELVDFAGIGKSATARHLDRLVKARFVAEIHEDGLTRYYAVGEVPPDVARRAAVLRSDSLRAVYELYRAHPETTLREASRRLGVSAPSVHRSKRKLESAGLLPVARGADVDAVAASA